MIAILGKPDRLDGPSQFEYHGLMNMGCAELECDANCKTDREKRRIRFCNPRLVLNKFSPTSNSIRQSFPDTAIQRARIFFAAQLATQKWRNELEFRRYEFG